MRHLRLFFWVIATVITLAAGSVARNGHAQETLPAHARTGSVERKDMTIIVDAVGDIHSVHETTLTTAVNGRLEWIANPGTMVEKGDPVARLDRRAVVLEHAAKRAEVRLADVAAQHTARQLQRIEELVAQDHASQADRDRAAFEHEIAKAELALAQARLDRVEEDLARLVIKAPFDGQVTSRHRRIGADVEFGDPLISMKDPNRLELRVQAPAKYLGSPILRPGEGFADATAGLAGTISAVIRAVDPKSQTFEVRIALSAPADGARAPGQAVRVRLPVSRYANVLTVDRDALILDETGTYVIRAQPDRDIQKIAVDVKEGQGDSVIITALSGTLASGDRVVIRGGERLMHSLNQ